MAIQTQSLTAVEHDYYVTKSGLPANAPLSEHKRAVLCSLIIPASAVNARKSVNELEMEAIHTYGATPSNTPPYDAWVAAAQAASVSIPAGASLNHIKYLFYAKGGFQ